MQPKQNSQGFLTIANALLARMAGHRTVQPFAASYACHEGYLSPSRMMLKRQPGSGWNYLHGKKVLPVPGIGCVLRPMPTGKPLLQGAHGQVPAPVYTRFDRPAAWELRWRRAQ